MKRTGFLAVILVSLLLLPACKANPASSPSAPSQTEALSLSVSLENGGEIGELSLLYGEAVTLSCQVTPEGEVTISSDSPAVSAANKGGLLILNADEVGSAQVTVTAQKEGFEEASFQFQVTVEEAPVGLALSQTSLSVVKGQTAVAAGLEHTAGELSLSYDEKALEVRLVPTVMTTGAPGGAYHLEVSAKETGEYPVTITCSWENHRTETVTLTVTVTP